MSQPIHVQPTEKPANCGVCPRWETCSRIYPIWRETIVCAVERCRTTMARMRARKKADKKRTRENPMDWTEAT